VAHLLYLGLLAACLVGTAPLELFLHVRVYARWRRLLGAVLPVLVLFGAWDLVGSATRTWTYTSAYLLGLRLPGRLPVEELLFFLVVPSCAVLTYEAVRVRRPRWSYGDEADIAPGDEAGDPADDTAPAEVAGTHVRNQP
jgi:lycopene cyclase domain-containing protein